MLYPHLIQGPAGRPVTLVTGLVLLVSMVPSSRAAGSLPELTIPEGFGVNIHFTGDPRDLDLIQAGGFRVIRMDFGWSGIERQKGVYDFEEAGYAALTVSGSPQYLRLAD